ncbi:MAG: Zn-ribbon domain-containing OB-fold protein [Syntrophomonas sp.]|nr:Zn-ribbon domain-containing OB-fold protein [Syntrophomonas sp.]
MNEIKYTLPTKIQDDNAAFWEGCKNQRLLFQKCSECGHIRYPASVVCPECLSLENEWVESKGEGTVYSYVVFRRPFDNSTKERIPYVVAVVELDDGPTFRTNIVDCEPEQVACDMRVSLKWEPAVGDLYLPMFKLAE